MRYQSVQQKIMNFKKKKKPLMLSDKQPNRVKQVKLNRVRQNKIKQLMHRRVKLIRVLVTHHKSQTKHSQSNNSVRPTPRPPSPR